MTALLVGAVLASLSTFVLFSQGYLDMPPSYSFEGPPPMLHPHGISSTLDHDATHPLPPLAFLVSQFRLYAGSELGSWQEKADKRNEDQLARLWKCVERGKGCTPGGAERRVVLLGAYEFESAYAGGYNGGESIW